MPSLFDAGPGAVQPGRTPRHRTDARARRGDGFDGGLRGRRADVAAAAVGEPRQPRAPERGRELRAVRRGRADRAAAGISTSVTVACAAVYFYARLAHAIVHISGTGLLKARTLLFTIAWIAFLTYAIVVLGHAM